MIKQDLMDIFGVTDPNNIVEKVTVNDKTQLAPPQVGLSCSAGLADDQSAELRREEFMRMAEGSVVAFRQAVEALFELRAILCDQTPESQEGEKERVGKESIAPPQ